MQKKISPFRFGALVRQARQAAGLSQKALAQQVNLDISYINRLESGERRPRRATLLKLAAALSIQGPDLEDWLVSCDLAPMPLMTGLSDRMQSHQPPPEIVGRSQESAAAPTPFWTRLEALGWDEISMRRLLQALEGADEPLRQQAAAMFRATLQAMTDMLSAPARRALIPAAGGQHRLLAFHVMQRLLLRTIGEAAALGIDECLLVLAPGTVEPLYAPLQAALELAVAPRVRLHYLVQPKPAGLGDAVLQAAPWIGQEPFLVLLPDEMLDVLRPSEFPQELHTMSQAFKQLDRCPLVAAEAVAKSRLSQGGVVRLGPTDIHPKIFQAEELVEKPPPQHPICEAASARSIVGRYFLNPDILPILESLKKQGRSPLELTEALDIQRRQGQAMYVFELSSSRRDIGGAVGRAGKLLED